MSTADTHTEKVCRLENNVLSMLISGWDHCVRKVFVFRKHMLKYLEVKDSMAIIPYSKRMG